MIDSDLAQLYGVATKVLNESVRRNSRRFPEDFMFQLTNDESRQMLAATRTAPDTGEAMAKVAAVEKLVR